MDAKTYWNKRFTAEQADIRPPPPSGEYDWVFERALEHFGPVEGKRLIDLGCGSGVASLYFAERGAQVVSVDYSEVAVDKLNQLCRERGIHNIQAIQSSAMDLGKLEQADLIFGSMILHHLEPFGEFAKVLRSAIKPGGKGYFWENNGRSDFLLWFRKHIVGRFGVPKFGDDEEFPLTPAEVDQLRPYFTVHVEVPKFLFFQMASSYLLRGGLKRPLKALDDSLFRFKPIRKYSYQQLVLLE